MFCLMYLKTKVNFMLRFFEFTCNSTYPLVITFESVENKCFKNDLRLFDLQNLAAPKSSCLGQSNHCYLDNK